MKNLQNRRCFIKQCTKLGISCFSFILLNDRILAKIVSDDRTNIIDLKKLSYCGIACENECELYKATKSNNTALKKSVFEKWNWKEKFGIEFYPEKIDCYNCKPENGILKIGMDDCEVRRCAIENGAESCIQCENLSVCGMELWENWPDFYGHMKNRQKQYLSQEGAYLIEIKEPN